MNSAQLKDHMANLTEDEQDALAQMALLRLKKRSRLEKIAAGPAWTRLGIFFPVVVSVALLGFRGNLADGLG